MLRERATCAVALLLALILPSCGRRSEPSMSDVDLLEGRFLADYYEFHPNQASHIGLRQYDGRSVSLSPAAIDRRIDRLKQHLALVIALRQRSLSPDEALLARLIDYRIRAELLDLEVIERWRHDPQEYLQRPFDFIVYLMNTSTGSFSDRLRSMVIHLHGLEAMMANMRANLVGVPELRVRRSLELGARLRAVLDGALPEWGVEAAGVDVRLREDFKLALERAVRSLDLGTEWLESSLLPVATGDPVLGRESFALKLLFEEVSEIPLPELSALAGRRLEESRSSFLELARRLAPDRSPAELVRMIGAERGSAGDTESDLRSYVDEVRGFSVDRGLVPETAAQIAVEVRAAPDYLRGGPRGIWLDPPPSSVVSVPGDSADEEWSPAELESAGLYYATPPADWTQERKDARFAELHGAALALAAARETVPGRYLMSYYAAGIPNASRRILASRGAQDGWAEYAEEVVLEQGYGSQDQAFAVLHAWRSLVAACRLVAVVRLHTEGATLEESQRLFVESCFLTSEAARREAEDALLDPVGAFGVLAKSQILDLREQYRDRLGAAFRLAEFHKEFLEEGPIPISLVRQRLLASE